jgi:hypothetical protein
LFFGYRAFPGVQSSRKGPRGAAKHQYKNLLPIALAAGGERSRVVVSSMGESEPSSEAHDDEEYEEELEASSSSFTIAGSSSSPVSSPQQASPVRHRRQAYESSPVSDESSSSSSSSSFYFSSAPGPVPSSPASSALEDGDQLASSPTLSFSYSSSPSSSPLAVMPMMTHSAEWMPPILQVVDGVSAQHHHCQHLPYHQHELEEGAQSSFDDIIDAYGAEAAAAAEQGVWEGDDVEAFFSITTSPYAASSFLMPSAHGYGSFGTDFGFVGANERREEEAQMMWCSSGSSVEDILSANKGEEWIDNILQGCN